MKDEKTADDAQDEAREGTASSLSTSSLSEAESPLESGSASETPVEDGSGKAPEATASEPEEPGDAGGAGWGGILLALFALLAAAAFAFAWWGRSVLYEKPAQMKEGVESVEVRIEEGDSARRIMARIREAGLEISDLELRVAARLHAFGMSRIHTGLYRIPRGVTPVGVLDIFAAGPLIDRQLRIPDGAPIWEVRAIFASAPDLRQDSASMNEKDLMEALGLFGFTSLEGFFAPDTYYYGSGTSDLVVMRRAVERQKMLLKNAWNYRELDVALITPYEALILASIIEKETGDKSDRHLVSSVFHNRLRAGMILQTDPTVIYGLGPQWKGTLTRNDLRSDTPYNTYRISGLPPTPIGMPGAKSIEAALHPAKTPYFYFVARGDGTSEFSRTLQEHNRAVRRFILKRPAQKGEKPVEKTP